MLDFSLICLPFASDDVYARLLLNKYLLFSTVIFGSIFGECLRRLNENTAVSFISLVDLKISHILVYKIILRFNNTNSTTVT